MNRFNLTWKDLGKALIVTVIGNIMYLIMSIPEDQFPTWAMIKSNMIVSFKFGFLPYLLKNLFTDQVKEAQATIRKSINKQN